MHRRYTALIATYAPRCWARHPLRITNPAAPHYPKGSPADTDRSFMDGSLYEEREASPIKSDQGGAAKSGAHKRPAKPLLVTSKSGDTRVGESKLFHLIAVMCRCDHTSSEEGFHFFADRGLPSFLAAIGERGIQYAHLERIASERRFGLASSKRTSLAGSARKWQTQSHITRGGVEMVPRFRAVCRPAAMVRKGATAHDKASCAARFRVNSLRSHPNTQARFALE